MFELIQQAKRDGIIRPEYASMSAKQLRRVDQQAAERLADWLAEHRAELVKSIAGVLTK